jgi:hypothetical protein
MKTYLFNRDAAGRALITVKDGDTLYPLKHIVVHSPKGMDYGYAGGGPADAAISILYDLLGVKTEARVYFNAEWEFVTSVDADEGGSIPEDEILDWLKVNAPELMEVHNVHTA